MLLLTAFCVLGLNCLLVLAQIVFSQPVARQVIAGGVPFLVTCSDSLAAPHFSQMSNFSMLLFAGSYASPKVLYAWDLESMNPSTVQNSITIPRLIGPSAITSYFLGMSGWLSLNTSISVTYFSSKFSLQNMTGPSSIIPSSTSTSTSSTATSTTGRLILCEDSDGDFSVGENGLGVVVNQACELAAVAVISLLPSSTSVSSTRVSATSVSTATPAVMSDYSAQVAVASVTAKSTQSATGSGNTGAQTSTPSAVNSSGTTTPRQGARMVFCLIIAVLVLVTIIALFWIWRRYRNKNATAVCNHLDCGHSKIRKQCDRILRPKSKLIVKASAAEGDAEKGSTTTVTVERTVSVDVEVSPVSSRTEMDPRAFDRAREREAEAEAAAVMAALASKAAAVRRQRFEEAMGNRASRRASRRTIVAELEGDLGMGASAAETPPMPDIEDDEKRDRVSALGAMQRKTMVGQGQQVTVVKGRDAAMIVRVGSGRKAHASSSSRVIEGTDLPPMPVHWTEDDDDDNMNETLQVLRGKGDSDETDGSDGIVGRSRGEGLEDNKVDSREEEPREDETRIQEARKKKLRHKRNQVSVEMEQQVALVVARMQS